MDVTTGPEFFAVLEKSRLLTGEQWTQAQRRLAESPERTAAEWAQEFSALGWLTDWQARQLLCGRHTLFMGKYKLLDRLGGGGMGVVFTAHHAMTDRVVALKVMNKSIVSNPLALARFKAEVRLLCALGHPNIIAAYDADCVGNTLFLVMEYGRGQDLRAWLQKYETLPIDWVCECIRQAALGLQHAHERGLVHRDIKPENLLVEDPQPFGRPSVKILDLGLARLMGAESPEEAALREAGQIMGTADYVAPEQVEQTEEADVRSDIFSLGCTLFKLLSGRLPFEGANYAEKLLARVARDAAAPSSFRPEIPAALDRVVAKMLKRNPDERFQSPAEVAEALYPFTSEGKLAQATPPPLPPPVAAAPVTPPPVTLATVAPAPATPAAVVFAPDTAAPAVSVTPFPAPLDKPRGDDGLGEFFSRLSNAAEAPREAADSAAESIAVETIPARLGEAAAAHLGPAIAVADRPAPAASQPVAQPAPPITPAPSTSPASTSPAKPAGAAPGRLAAMDARKRNWLLGVGLGVAISVPVIGLLAFLLQSATLELDWPLDQRQGSGLNVDGRPAPIPAEDPAIIRLPPGQHRVVLRRRGYEQLEWNLSCSRGDRFERKVEWKKLGPGSSFGLPK